jgi:hypothetical protein
MQPVTYEEGQRLLKKSPTCGICGANLTLAWSAEKNSHVIRCSNDINHIGIARKFELSAYDTPDELNIGNISRIRRRNMVTKYGEEKGTALAKYAGRGQLDIPQAKEIIITIWPGAPAVEVLKAAMVCQQYGLNPLMKHLYLIPFNTKVSKKGEPDRWEETYSMVLGIKASRLIARRAGAYSYLDDTPRIMTEAEQIKIFGEVDTSNIVAITRLQDPKGNSAIGTGKWPKDKGVKGEDKGNTKLNMAMVRSERQGLERLFPDSQPPDVPEVIDERYQGLPDGRQVDVASGEIKDVIPAEFTAEQNRTLDKAAKEYQKEHPEVMPPKESNAAWDALRSEGQAKKATGGATFTEVPLFVESKKVNGKTDPASIQTLGALWQALIADFPEAIADTEDCMNYARKVGDYKKAGDIKDFPAVYRAIAEKIKAV